MLPVLFSPTVHAGLDSIRERLDAMPAAGQGFADFDVSLSSVYGLGVRGYVGQRLYSNGVVQLDVGAFGTVSASERAVGIRFRGRW